MILTELAASIRANLDERWESSWTHVKDYNYKVSWLDLLRLKKLNF